MAFASGPACHYFSRVLQLFLGGFFCLCSRVFFFNCNNPTKTVLLMFFPYSFFYQLDFAPPPPLPPVYFIKTKSLCVTLPVRNLTIYFYVFILYVFLLLYSFDGTFLYVHFKNNIIHLKIEIITEYICCLTPRLF